METHNPRLTVREWYRWQRRREAVGGVPSDAAVVAHRLVSGEDLWPTFTVEGVRVVCDMGLVRREEVCALIAADLSLASERPWE